MRPNLVKKLLVAPLTVLTLLLAVAFLAPGTARSAAHAIAPTLQSAIFGSSSKTAAGSSTSRSGAPGAVAMNGSASSGNSSSNNGVADATGLGSADNTTAIEGILSGDVGHTQATTTIPNCGRYGNGFHGGKHNFICPNRPFPGVESHF